MRIFSLLNENQRLNQLGWPKSALSRPKFDFFSPLMFVVN